MQLLNHAVKEKHNFVRIFKIFFPVMPQVQLFIYNNITQVVHLFVCLCNRNSISITYNLKCKTVTC